eukprot:CAMPEP_0176379920 /NCGR_PEP_ID=MMETSP0126-20121128/30724_1 /TAXON_ID=141414 ORGANISM="Strombidinopsis acuminatum, Strain SPMC142" /NCGR_SAMPLE_ID=MMETSP0126 /ASSEMBLY_ACC=CAM_ASM_000229 /LENGTH=59 /DNA_ID=CAMNT_0017742947 /DNA_START=88 /DNA_END=264 /DNA_ORIENTATION=+
MIAHKPTDFETCSTTQAIDGMMRDIGKENLTHGHFKHWVGGVLTGSMPMSLLGEKMAAD